MSTTHPTDPQTSDPQTTDPQAHPAAVADPDRVQQLDPRTLLLDRNVRTRQLSAAQTRDEARAFRELVSSIRRRGVQQPIIAVATGDGGVRVRHGERRTRAAIAAGKVTVPVIVRPAETDTADEQAERIASQIDENRNRRGLSGAEQLGAFAELAALGRSPGQIAAATSTRRRDVVDGLAAAGVDTVRETVIAAELTLAQGAGLAEFADDPEGYEALLAAATGRGSGYHHDFTHLLARLRADRAESAQKRALLTELAAAGVTVVEAPWSNEAVKALDDLTDDPEPDPAATGGEGEGEDGSGPGVPAPISPAAHAGCPGHVAFLRRDHSARTQTGWTPTVAVYGCADPAGHGHRARRSYLRLTPAGAPPKRVDETAEQAAAREAAHKDTERATRRRVRAGNAAWRAAETVRREYLRGMLARKTPPAGAGVYVATAITLDAPVLSKAAENDHRLPAELLSATTGPAGRERVTELCEHAGDARAHVITLGLVCGGLEASIGVHSWRYRDDHAGADWRGESRALGRYLRFLAATGYPLAAIERFAIGEDVDDHDVFTPPGRAEHPRDDAGEHHDPDEDALGLGLGDQDLHPGPDTVPGEAPEADPAA